MPNSEVLFFFLFFWLDRFYFLDTFLIVDTLRWLSDNKLLLLRIFRMSLFINVWKNDQFGFFFPFNWLFYLTSLFQNNFWCICQPNESGQSKQMKNPLHCPIFWEFYWSENKFIQFAFSNKQEFHTASEFQIKKTKNFNWKTKERRNRRNQTTALFQMKYMRIGVNEIYWKIFFFEKHVPVPC